MVIAFIYLFVAAAAACHRSVTLDSPNEHTVEQIGVNLLGNRRFRMGFNFGDRVAGLVCVVIDTMIDLDDLNYTGASIIRCRQLACLII